MCQGGLCTRCVGMIVFLYPVLAIPVFIVDCTQECNSQGCIIVSIVFGFEGADQLGRVLYMDFSPFVFMSALRLVAVCISDVRQ